MSLPSIRQTPSPITGILKPLLSAISIFLNPKNHCTSILAYISALQALCQGITKMDGILSGYCAKATASFKNYDPAQKSQRPIAV